MGYHGITVGIILLFLYFPYSWVKKKFGRMNLRKTLQKHGLKDSIILLEMHTPHIQKYLCPYCEDVQTVVVNHTHFLTESGTP